MSYVLVLLAVAIAVAVAGVFALDRWLGTYFDRSIDEMTE